MKYGINYRQRDLNPLVLCTTSRSLSGTGPPSRRRTEKIKLKKMLPSSSKFNTSNYSQLDSPRSVDDSDEIPLPVYGFKNQGKTFPVHTAKLSIKSRKIIFRPLFSCIDFINIVNSISSLDGLIKRYNGSSCPCFITDKFFKILSDSEIDRFTRSII